MSEERAEHGEEKVIPYSVFRRAREEKDAARAVREDLPTDQPGQDEGGEQGTNAIEQIARLLRDELRTLPEVRAEKVRLVQERLRARFYDRSEVLTEIADRILGRLPEDQRQSKEGEGP
jgi:hypothetical protein